MVPGPRIISQPVFILQHLVPPPLFLSIKIIVVAQHVCVPWERYMSVPKKPSCRDVGSRGVRFIGCFHIAVKSV